MGVIEQFRTPTREVAVRWAWGSVIANAVLVLTGGLVRLTDSGLGCPTWPRCTDSSLVPHRALGIHGVIEFGNRMLTWVLVIVAVGLVVAVVRWAAAGRFEKRLAIGLALGIPAQAVVGGISVLSHLNPWVVSLHLILSMTLIAGSVVLLLRVRADASTPTPLPYARLVLAAYVALWAVVYLGTVVTGSGPHAGDIHAHRNGLRPASVTQLHADAVFLLIGLTIGCWLGLRLVAPVAARAALVLLVVELAQSLIGFVQYFTNLPVALVAAHLAGAAVLIAYGTRLVLAVHATADERTPVTSR